MGGTTTIEYCHRREKDNPKRHVTFTFHPIHPSKKYNFGCYKNWTMIFNTNPLLWFLPVNKNETGDGCFFDEEEIEKRAESLQNGGTQSPADESSQAANTSSSI